AEASVVAVERRSYRGMPVASPIRMRAEQIGAGVFRLRMLMVNAYFVRVPGLSEWHWLLTGGHASGHVSFFREDDRTLIAGDAVVTTRQESTTNVLFQRPIVWRPPAYSTPDWESARRSVETLAALDP